MRQFLHQLFFPKESNNYRAKILHHQVLLFLTLFFFASGLLMSFLRTNYPSVLGTFSNISDQQLLDITNEDRRQQGLSALSLNSQLTNAAAGKANDMFTKDYWAHVSPDGTTPWVFIKGAGYNYVYAGENLARGFTTPQDVVNAWMASPTHRENMLSPHYKDVGFSVQTGKLNGEDTVLVVEMFGSTNFATDNVATQEEKPVEVTAANGSPNSQNTLAEQKIKFSPTPTFAPTPTLTLPKPEVAANTLGTSKPLVNGITFSSASARLVISIFLFVLIMDMIVIERKKIVRFVGHNLDHVIFFSILFLVILILAKGVIL